MKIDNLKRNIYNYDYNYSYDYDLNDILPLYKEDKPLIKKNTNYTLNRLKKYYGDNLKTSSNKLLLNNNEYYTINILGNTFIGNINNTNDIYNILKKLIEYDEVITTQNYNVYGIIPINQLIYYSDFNGYEVISNYNINNGYNVYKFYLDIELYLKKKCRWFNNNLSKINKIILDILDDIIKLFKINFKYEIDKNKIFIADASGDDENDNEIYKYSNHIILPIYVKNIEELYIIYTYLNTNIFSLKSNYFKDDNIIDGNVYVKNNDKSRKWRLLNNSKFNYRPLKPLKLDNYGYFDQESNRK